MGRAFLLWAVRVNTATANQPALDIRLIRQVDYLICPLFVLPNPNGRRSFVCLSQQKGLRGQ